MQSQVEVSGVVEDLFQLVSTQRLRIQSMLDFTVHFEWEMEEARVSQWYKVGCSPRVIIERSVN